MALLNYLKELLPEQDIRMRLTRALEFIELKAKLPTLPLPRNGQLVNLTCIQSKALEPLVLLVLLRPA